MKAFCSTLILIFCAEVYIKTELKRSNHCLDGMKFFLSLLNVPIGYLVPPFPSLYWPLGPERSSFEALYLYYTFDMWKFMVYWSIIMFGGLYFVTSLLAAAIQLRNQYKVHSKLDKMSVSTAIFIVLSYVLLGLTHGFAGGAIVGLIVLSIYRTGLLNMSTWIPFTWSLAMVAYDVCSLYSLSLVLL